jgi:pyruvate formate lyase activating enzyme
MKELVNTDFKEGFGVNAIYSLTPFSLLDYQDFTSCIVWFAGCNMKCSFCYNPEIVHGKGVYSYQNILDFLATRKGLLDGVVFSGGECTLHKGLPIFAREIKKRGFTIKLDSNGLKPDVIKALIEEKLVDFIALDFKSLPADFYKITKSKSFQKFEQTLDLLLRLKFNFEVRTTIHSELIRKDDLITMIQFLERKGYSSNYYLQPYRNNVETISPLPNSSISEELREVSSIEFPIIWRD